MNNEQLQQLTERISVEWFGRPFRHEAKFNGRLKTTGGRYMLQSHNIEVNKKHLEVHGQEEIEGILKHELCHYHLHLEGKGYKHQDPEFKKLLNEVGAPRYCKPLGGKVNRKITRLLVYQCADCQLIYNRKRKMDTARYVCGKCKGKIKFIKEQKIE